MRKVLGEVAALSWQRRLLLCATAVLLVACRVLLSLSGLARTRWAIGRAATVLPPFERVEDPDRISWAVRCTDAVLPGTGTCLSQAVVTGALLSDNGHDGTVRIGVAKSASAFRAHAWVVRDEDVIVGDRTDLDCYRTLSSWEASR